MQKRTVVYLLCFLMFLPMAAKAGREPIFRLKKSNKEVVTDTTKTKKESEYEKLFKAKHTSVKGVFNLHNIGGKLYFEMPVKLLGREMLIGSTVSEISDNGDAIIGSKPKAPLHVFFTKQDENIQLRRVSCDYVTDDSASSIAKAIELSSIGAIMKNIKIAAYSTDSSSVVFEMTEFFVSDNKDMPPFDSNGYYEGSGYTRSATYNSDRSFLGEIKAFTDNVTIKSNLSFTYSLTSAVDKKAAAKDIPFTAIMTRSIVLLDEKPCMPRVGDPRMAIFPTAKSLFTNKYQAQQNIYYSNRWRLEPSDEDAYKRGEKVTPKKPITFYIDPNFPEKWKPFIKEGVQQWNEVFEEIGFKDAVLAMEFPVGDSTFDPDNFKYSCIRYAPISIANAMGPSWTDPRSGEILNASVYVYHNIIELLNNWIFIQTSQTDERVRTRNIPDEIIGDGLRYVIRHELGHCLGLMHNMSASAVIPVDSLRSPSFTQKYGTTTSIMDYSRFNYVAQPGDFQKGVKLTPPRFGEYDHFSIKWLYTYFPGKTKDEITDILQLWIQGKSINPVYRFGKQQGTPLDPRSQTEDLGDDNCKASEYGIKNLKYILPRYSEWVMNQDIDFSYRNDIYDAIISQYARYLNHVLANIGGVYLQEVKKGDVGEQYKSVPKEIQKKALQFMISKINDLDWLDDKTLLKQLGISGSAKKVLQQSIAKAIVGAPQKVRFSATIAEVPYTFKECADDVYAYVWQSTLKGKNPDETERMIQKEFVKAFIVNAQLLPKRAEQAGFYISIDDEIMGSEHGNSKLPLCSCSSHSLENNTYNPVSGYGSFIAKLNPLYTNESECYSYLLSVRALLKKSIQKSSNEVRVHYELLLRDLNNSIELK